MMPVNRVEERKYRQCGPDAEKQTLCRTEAKPGGLVSSRVSRYLYPPADDEEYADSLRARYGRLTHCAARL